TLADGLRRAHAARSQRAVCLTQSLIGDEQSPLLYSWRGPGRFCNPAAGQGVVVRRRFHTVRHPGAQHWFRHDAGIDALQPIIPPTQHFLKKPDLRAGKCEMRISMRPGSDESFARDFQSLEQARNGVLISVGPTADGVYRTLDRVIILAYRSVPPITVAPLMLQPMFEKRRGVSQPPQPHRAPKIGDENRVGRKAHGAKKE